MENTGRREKAHWIYVLAAGYVVISYGHLFMPSPSNFDIIKNLPWLNTILDLCIFFLPLIYGIISLILIAVFWKSLDRNRLLNCVILIKYSLIPLFLIGGALVFFCLAFSFIPVPFMIFMGPLAAVTFSFIGWCIVAGGAVFPIAYAIRAHKDGIHGKVLTITACILQFFFVADVISVMVLTLKEKRWRKLTLTVIILLALFAVACILGLAAFILSIAVS